MNILAIGAHPDDLEILCGGTLAKYASQGHKVVMVHVSTGNVGHTVLRPEELIKIRAQEAREAGALIGAEVISLNEMDLFVQSDNMKARDKVIDIIRYTKPDIIITQSPHDYMDDHEETSRLVYRATMAASVPHYKSKYEHYDKLTALYYMEPAGGVNSFPEEFVDITDFIDVKMEMVEKHVSQHKWIREHDGLDILDMTRTLSKMRGYQCGVGYAEGFAHCKQYLKLSTRRLLP
jgi:LmbE family N-acetylglucosaminyl deacetylase